MYGITRALERIAIELEIQNRYALFKDLRACVAIDPTLAPELEHRRRELNDALSRRATFEPLKADIP